MVKRLLVLLTLAGCPHQGVPAEDVDAIVRIRTEVKDAALWVDGRYIAPIDAIPGGVSVTPGVHRFELRHDDYFSHYEQLELAPKERRTLDIQLAPVLE